MADALKKTKEKLFMIRKYVFANSQAEALKKASRIKPESVIEIGTK